MHSSILNKYQFTEISRILCLLQIHTDNMLYSKNSPAEDHFDTRAVSMKHHEKELRALFAPEPVNNKTVRKLLEGIHENFVNIAKESLPLVSS